MAQTPSPAPDTRSRAAAPSPETAPVKRKIAAILAADVYGYSRMMAEDEEGVLRRLAACRTVFDEFVTKAGGRIFNTAGDSVMCEFESAVEAVRCAVDIQDALRARSADIEPSKRLLFRIGISIGDVVERNGDLLGDGVNVAARLESLAEPGGITVSRSVHEAVLNKVSVGFHDMGAREVKNLAPVHAYAITAPGARLAVAPEAPPKPAPKAAPAPAAKPPTGGLNPGRAPEPRGLPVPAIAAGVAGLALAGGLAWFLLGSSSPPPAPPVAQATPVTPAAPAPTRAVTPTAPAAPRTQTALAPAAPSAPEAPRLAPVPTAPPAATVAIEELRAAPGRACADLVFGGLAPTRVPVATREDGTPAPSNPAGLCGFAIQVAPAGARLGFRLDPALSALAIVSNAQPGPAAGELAGATVMFRATARLPASHVIELVDHGAQPPAARRIVHDLGTGRTAAPGANRLAGATP